MAIMEGLSLAAQGSSLPIEVESCFLETVNMIQSEGLNRSHYASLVHEIKDMRTCTSISHIRRCQNSISDDLAVGTLVESPDRRLRGLLPVQTMFNLSVNFFLNIV